MIPSLQCRCLFSVLLSKRNKQSNKVIKDHSSGPLDSVLENKVKYEISWAATVGPLSNDLILR